MEMTAFPASLSWLTVTYSVTFCPAWSVPPVLLRVTSSADELADQVTGPPTAVSVICPAEPRTRARLPGDTVRVPAGTDRADTDVAEVTLEAGAAVDDSGAPGFWADRGAWVASAIIASPLLPAGAVPAARAESVT
jgi:hypothetical protein